MTARDKATLKSYFEQGDIPTQQQFADLIDSIPDSSQAGVPLSRVIVAQSPLKIDGQGAADLTQDRTLSILPASNSNAGSMSAVDKVKLDSLPEVLVFPENTPAESGQYLTAYDAATGEFTKAPAGSTATAISVDTSNFDKNLTSAEDTVQKALDKLDDLVAGGEAGDHSHNFSSIISFRIDGYLATGSGIYTFPVPKNMVFSGCYISGDTLGTAGNTIVDVNKNGTTVFTAQANRPTLAYNDADRVAKSGTQEVTSLLQNDLITIDLDSVATGAIGLTIDLIFTDTVDSSSSLFYIDQSGGTSDTYGQLTGLINGSNKVFTVSAGSYTSHTLQVFLNGQLQTQGTDEDWVETSPLTGTFTFNTAPTTGDLITVMYGNKIGAGSALELVTGPASSTDSTIPVFNGVTGKLLKGSTLTTNDNGDLAISGIGTGATRGLTVTQISSNNTGASVGLYKKRDTGGLLDQDRLGIYNLFGYDGTQYFSAAMMFGFASGAWDSTHHGSQLEFRTTDTSVDATLLTRMAISPSGNVGIGTTQPGCTLHVVQLGGGGTNGAIIEDDQTASYSQQFVIRGHSNTNQQFLIGYNTENNFASLQAVVQGTGYKPIGLNPDGGNVGIRTTAPLTQLSIHYTGVVGPNTGVGLRIGENSTTGKYAYMHMVDSPAVGNPYFMIQSLHQGTGYRNLILQPSGANVGIGNTDPTARLHVNSAITGGEPSTNTQADPNLIARFQGGSVNFDLGGHNGGPQWIQPRVWGGASYTNYGLHLCPLGGGVSIASGGIASYPNKQSLTVNTTNGLPQIGLYDQQTNNTYGGAIRGYFQNGVGGRLGLGTIESGSWYERLSINHLGQIGIGALVTANASLLVTGNPLQIGSDQTANADASLHIKTVYGGNGRLTQMHPTAAANKAALNLMASTGASSNFQWWSWGVSYDDYFVISPGTDFSATGIYVSRTGNLFVYNNCSALSFTDRTPYFNGDAVSELIKIQAKGNEIDHDSLPAFAKVKKRSWKNHDDNHPDFGGYEIDVVERDLGAMISILTVAIKQLHERIAILESK